MAEESDALRSRLEDWIGKPLGGSGPAVAPDEVNLPMIRHWVDALGDRNPIYLDLGLAVKTRHGGIVAPPAMLQTWAMGRPPIAGIAERGGTADAIYPENPISVLADAIASRDFMPVHHGRDYAKAQSAPDIFMNIPPTNGYVSRFVTDWAGPQAMLRRIAIRLGLQRCPARPCASPGRLPVRAGRATSASSRWRSGPRTSSGITSPAASFSRCRWTAPRREKSRRWICFPCLTTS